MSSENIITALVPFFRRMSVEHISLTNLNFSATKFSLTKIW